MDQLTAYRIGQRLRVRTQTGRVIEKIVYEIKEHGPLVCTPEEFEQAQADSRPPRGSGWPPADIVG